MMIGLNYEADMLDSEEYKTYHKLTGHLGLETVKNIVGANRTDSLASVILCHLGHDSVDLDKCLSGVSEAAGIGVKVDYAATGKQWELRKGGECPF